MRRTGVRRQDDVGTRRARTDKLFRFLFLVRRARFHSDGIAIMVGTPTRFQTIIFESILFTVRSTVRRDLYYYDAFCMRHPYHYIVYLRKHRIGGGTGLRRARHD